MVKRDPQREKAVADLNRKRLEEKRINEPVIVSPSLSPTGQQATITRAQFQEFQRGKQIGELEKQNQLIDLKKQLQEGQIPTTQTTAQAPTTQTQTTQTLETPQQEQGAIQGVLGTREFQPLGITGLEAAQRLLENPQEQAKRAATETAIGGTLALGATGQLLGLANKIKAASAFTKSILGLGISSLVGKYSVAGRQKVREATNDFSNAQSNINDIINGVNQGLYPNPLEALNEYERNVQVMRNMREALKLLTDTKLQSFLFGGKDDLADVENFLDNQERNERLRLQQAILTPNPTLIINDVPQQQEGFFG